MDITGKPLRIGGKFGAGIEQLALGIAQIIRTSLGKSKAILTFQAGGKGQHRIFLRALPGQLIAPLLGILQQDYQGQKEPSHHQKGAEQGKQPCHGKAPFSCDFHFFLHGTSAPLSHLGYLVFPFLTRGTVGSPAFQLLHSYSKEAR